MKKLFSALCIIALFVTAFSACGKKDSQVSSTASSIGSAPTGKSISIVTTIFPEYDWVREIAKGNENVDVTMLLDSGVDLHSFQPTADDIVKISNCDMFIYVGGESDEWVEDALKEATNENMVVINLLDVLGDSVKKEELIDGMQHEHEDEDEDHEHEDEEHGHEDEDHEHEDEEHEHEHEDEYDEHVWLSLKTSGILCKAIAEELGKMDTEKKDLYDKNVTAYIEELDSLDKEYENTVQNATCTTVLFGDRFPFRYLVDDYGLDYYAAFSGCSAETEASFETISFLSGKVDELELNSILQTESTDGKIAQTIKDTSKAKDQNILTLNAMQSVTANDVSNGETYIGIMKDNLKVLEQAIN